jgi:hypothetical protein
MAYASELHHDGTTCKECGCFRELKVMRSNAGWYLGTECNCGPWSRETCYFTTEEEAEAALANPDEFRRYV